MNIDSIREIFASIWPLSDQELGARIAHGADAFTYVVMILEQRRRAGLSPDARAREDEMRWSLRG